MVCKAGNTFWGVYVSYFLYTAFVGKLQSCLRGIHLSDRKHPLYRYFYTYNGHSAQFK